MAESKDPKPIVRTEVGRRSPHPDADTVMQMSDMILVEVYTGIKTKTVYLLTEDQADALATQIRWTRGRY